MLKHYGLTTPELRDVKKSRFGENISSRIDEANKLRQSYVISEEVHGQGDNVECTSSPTYFIFSVYLYI